MAALTVSSNGYYVNPRGHRPAREFPENPSVSVPRARDSGGSRNVKNFGAESSRPTPSLSTLLSRRSAGDRQYLLLACALRLWPDWTFTSWIPLERFHRLTSNSPFPSFAWHGVLLIRPGYTLSSIEGVVRASVQLRMTSRWCPFHAPPQPSALESHLREGNHPGAGRKWIMLQALHPGNPRGGVFSVQDLLPSGHLPVMGTSDWTLIVICPVWDETG